MTVDILIPYWGDPRLMRETVQSVLAQTRRDWILTVVDDAYPDPAIGAWLGSMTDPRIRYIRQSANVGITENYRTSLALAENEFCMFLGCDDILEPEYLDTVLSALERHPEASIVQPGVRVIGETGDLSRPLGDRAKAAFAPRGRQPHLIEGEGLAVSLLHGNWLYWPSLMFRTERLREVPFRNDYPLIQDLGLILDLVVGGASLLHVPDRCFRYRRHAKSASAATQLNSRRFPDERRFFDAIRHELSSIGWHRAARAAGWRVTSRVNALATFPTAIRRRDMRAGRRLLAHALAQPLTVR